MTAKELVVLATEHKGYNNSQNDLVTRLVPDASILHTKLGSPKENRQGSE